MFNTAFQYITSIQQPAVTFFYSLQRYGLLFAEAYLNINWIDGRVAKLETILSDSTHRLSGDDLSGLELLLQDVSILGRVDLLPRFIEAGKLMLDLVDNQENTVLHRAAECGLIETVRILIAAGAAINARNLRKKKPIDMAAAQEHVDIMYLLFHAGANIKTVIRSKKWLHTSNKEMLRCLISLGASVNTYVCDRKVTRSRSHRCVPPMTLLHRFIVAGDVAMVRFLVSAGALVNAFTNNGDTLLHVIVANKNICSRDAVAIMRCLLSNGADVNLTTAGGNKRTPLHEAARRGHKPLIHCLVLADADIDAKTTTGLTALHLAARYCNASVVQYFVNQDANVHATTNEGITPLHEAARWGSKQATQCLVAAKADINARTVQGITPWHLAARRSDAVLVQYFLTQGAKYIIAGGGSSPLHEAARWGCAASIRCLVQVGSVHQKTLRGRTPLYMALKTRNDEAIVCLQQLGATLGLRWDSLLRHKPSALMHYAFSLSLRCLNFVPRGSDETLSAQQLDENKDKMVAFFLVAACLPKNTARNITGVIEQVARNRVTDIGRALVTAGLYKELSSLVLEFEGAPHSIVQQGGF